MRYCIQVINLDRSQDRWNKMKENIEKFNIQNVSRFKAIDSRSLTEEQISLIDPEAWKLVQNKTKLFACDHVLGSIGCYLSHVFAMKNFVEEMNDKDFCVIVEDDIEFDSLFESKFRNVLVNAPIGWGLISLGKVVPKIFGFSLLPKIRSSGGIIFVSMPFVGATCYVVEKSYAKFLVDNAFPSKVQYDWYISQMLCRDPYKIYFITKPIVERNELSKVSDILKVTNIKADVWKAPKGLDGLKDRPKSFTFQGSCCSTNYSLLWIFLPISILLIIAIILVSCLYVESVKYKVLY